VDVLVDVESEPISGDPTPESTGEVTVVSVRSERYM
jgi:hypothetical protein